MPLDRARFVALAGALAALGILLSTVRSPVRGPLREFVPVQGEISDREFGRLIDALSEPEGYFDTDNFISNETSYLHVVDRLEARVGPGGAYLGVGPDQNFSYIVHSEPSIAVIADIRRQNMLQHLLFKVLIQESDGRYDFLCRLFARRCDGPPADSLPSILDRVDDSPSDDALFERQMDSVLDSLAGDYGVDLSPMDRERIAYVYRSFADAGLQMRFSSFGGNSVRYPTFADLALETDSTGDYAAFLGSDALFDRLRRFQEANRLIPIVADFAGGHAMGEAAAFLRASGFEVSVFYTSNVEYYLFGTSQWQAYLDNVRAFPFSDDAVFVRAYFPTYGIPHPQNVPGHRPTTLIQSVAGFLDDAASGRLATYWDVVSRHTY
jgi:hypothetical protein